ncbi:MAG: alanine:cation symporter family protein [Bacteroidales bacterium]|nr:alanine:cation symporter family protein [Bacteroidales bacterium]
MDFWNRIGDSIVAVSDAICGYPFFILLVGGGLFFLVYSGFAPVLHFGKAVQALRVKDSASAGQISSFEALSTAIAATVGMGNIAGVAIAISIGGAGTIFWMWVSALLGMATKFFEGTLAVMYKGKDSEGVVQGGPMYVITQGLGVKWKPLAVFFAVSGLFGTLCTMQSNQITEALTTTFIAPEKITATTRLITGLIITALVAVVALGGIKRIGKVASRLTPFMVGAYLLMVSYIIVTHIGSIPGVFRDILVGAFTPRAALGGGIASVITVALTGVRRAVFVNEAGVGTASMVHGASRNSEPVREGLVAMLGPSIDSGLVCTLTALAILIQKDVIPQAGMSSMQGLQLALNSFAASIPVVGRYLLLAILLIFAFSTMFSYSYYGTKCASYLFGFQKGKYYIYFYLCMIIVAAVVPLRAVVGFVDLTFALMAFPNMIALFALAPRARKEMKRFFKEYKKNK